MNDATFVFFESILAVGSDATARSNARCSRLAPRAWFLDVRSRVRIIVLYDHRD